MSLRISLSTALACLISILPALNAHAQGETGRRTQSFDNLTGFDLNPLQRMTQFSRINEMVPLEGAVDRQEYIVGPGDLFDVSVGGPQPVMVTLPVSADGHLMLPDAGAVDVAGRRLVEAQQIAMRALKEEFENVRVDVTLSQPRQFYVHVSGAVPAPGRFLATPVARVASVLHMAYMDTTHAPVSNLRFRPALRNVKVVHRDGTKEGVDLLKYYSTGNTAHNPYLRDGDVISIPTYDPDYDAVYVSGNVAYPGTYDYRSDDTVYDLLVLATGEDPPTGFSQVRLTRANEDGSVESEVFDITSLDRSVKVGVRDQVHALLHKTVRGEAAIEGWVEFPGTYPIMPGKTSLQELVRVAGGLREGALEHGAYLERASLPKPELAADQNNRFEYLPGGMQTLRPDTLTVMQSTRLTTMSFSSRAYLAHELRLQNRVPLDLNAAMHGETEPLYLQDGDKVVVPRDENAVFVIGQVNRPGYISYRAERSFDEYIAASGGLSVNAGDAYIIQAGTNKFVRPGEAPIRSGDKIFVDRAMMQADTPETQRLLTDERRADLEERSRLVQAIVSSISAAATVITTYLLIRRELN